MTVFLIVVAVLVVLIAAVLSLSATFTVVYDKKWTTTVSFLFIEKEISLSKILSFVLFPEKTASEVAEKQKKKKEELKNDSEPHPIQETEAEIKEEVSESVAEKAKKNSAKPNPILKIWRDEGIVGIFSLLTNLVETANSAILTLIRGLHIYSLYVMIIVGGYDADIIGRTYGTVCQYYYPVKGIILNQMKVDNYDDVIIPDFIADRSEFEFQLIASVNVYLILKVAFKAGIVFLKNLIENKKGTEKQ